MQTGYLLTLPFKEPTQINSTSRKRKEMCCAMTQFSWQICWPKYFALQTAQFLVCPHFEATSAMDWDDIGWQKSLGIVSLRRSRLHLQQQWLHFFDNQKIHTQNSSRTKCNYQRCRQCVFDTMVIHISKYSCTGKEGTVLQNPAQRLLSEYVAHTLCGPSMLPRIDALYERRALGGFRTE